MRFSGSLCGSFFPKTNSDNSRAVSFCFESFLPTRNVGLPGVFSPVGIAAHRKIAIAIEPDLHTGATLFPCGGNEDVDDGLVPAGTDRFDFGDGNRPIPLDSAPSKK